MEIDLWEEIRMLTPKKPKTEKLDLERLKAFGHHVRDNPEQIRALYSYFVRRSQHDSSQVRFLTLQLLHYIFMRSAHFRSVFASSYVMPFLNNFRFNLPPPKSFIDRVQSSLQFAVSQWEERFGKIYPQLKIIYKIVCPPIERNQYHDLKVASLALQVECAQHRQKMLLKEIKNLTDLMSISEPKSEEYCSIVTEALKAKKLLLNRQISELESLRIEARGFASGTPLIDLLETLYQELLQAQSSAITYGIDDDDFEEV